MSQAAVMAALKQITPETRALLRGRVDANLARHDAHHCFENRYSDGGPLRRELYAKHLQFFVAGRSHMERALIGANRTGKSTCAAYEVVAHMTGKYPSWWNGKRFD